VGALSLVRYGSVWVNIKDWATTLLSCIPYH